MTDKSKWFDKVQLRCNLVILYVVRALGTLVAPLANKCTATKTTLTGKLRRKLMEKSHKQSMLGERVYGDKDLPVPKGVSPVLVSI